MGTRPSCRKTSGFTLIELLLVIAIIGVMSGLIITTIVNATADARLTLARQQQVTLQDALNSWIAGYTNAQGKNELQSTRNAYNGASSSLDKLALLGANYLQQSTYDHLTTYSSATQIKSEALEKSGKYLTFSAWTATNYPVVQMGP